MQHDLGFFFCLLVPLVLACDVRPALNLEKIFAAGDALLFISKSKVCIFIHACNFYLFNKCRFVMFKCCDLIESIFFVGQRSNTETLINLTEAKF